MTEHHIRLRAIARGTEWLFEDCCNEWETLLVGRLESEWIAMSRSDVSCRYTADDHHWQLTVMGDSSRSRHGGSGSQPEWLLAIVDAARVSGRVWSGEGRIVVWFRVDLNNNLTEFIDWMVKDD